MIRITEKNKCCGCEGCVQICPKHCISLSEDAEGFMYPKVDEQLCIHCGLCEKVCPFLNVPKPIVPLQVFAAKTKSEEDLLNSSSGGLFALMARKVLGMGGVVFGASFSSDYKSVYHKAIEKEEDLLVLRGSKYLQSRIGNTFAEAKTYLEAGRFVLFCGTSCQLMALRLFLQKNYDNLLTIDLICHGVPSPKVWRKYLKEIVPENCKIHYASFRDKCTGWQDFSFTLSYSNPCSSQSQQISHPYAEDSYMWLFLNDYTLRPSCYSCPAKSGNSGSDITIADYWGIQTAHPDFFDNKGVGLLIINSEKGKDFVSGVGLEVRESSLYLATRENPSYYKSKAKPSGRALCFKKINNNKLSVEEVAHDFRVRKKIEAIPSKFIRIIRKIKKRLL